MAKKTTLKSKGMPARKLSSYEAVDELADKTSCPDSSGIKAKTKRSKITRLPGAVKKDTLAAPKANSKRVNKNTANPANDKSKAVLRQERINSAIDSLHQGSPDRSILAKLDQEFSIGFSQARRDLEAAYRVIEKDSSLRSIGNWIDRAVLQRDEVVRRAMEKSDLRVALAAMDGRDKLLGVMSPERFEGENSAQSLLDIAELAFRSQENPDIQSED